MQTLVTGITGSIGAALAPALSAAGHDVRGFTRDARRAPADVDDVVEGDALTGAGLDAALDGVDVAYYLIHSMEADSAQPKATASRQARPSFDAAEHRTAERFAAAARRAGVGRIVYLGGLLPGPDHPLSRHIGSRLAVEETLLAAVPGSIAFRASIVIAAGSRSFRFLVRLVERVRITPLPDWRDNHTQPIDGRDVTAFLSAAATAPQPLSGRAWDLGGPDVLSYGEMIEQIADVMLVPRPQLPLGCALTPLAAPVAARIAGEDVELIRPLMESLQSDLLPRDNAAAGAFGVRLHGFTAAVERSLRDWEATEEVRAR